PVGENEDADILTRRRDAAEQVMPLQHLVQQDAVEEPAQPEAQRIAGAFEPGGEGARVSSGDRFAHGSVLLDIERLTPANPPLGDKVPVKGREERFKAGTERSGAFYGGRNPTMVVLDPGASPP